MENISSKDLFNFLFWDYLIVDIRTTEEVEESNGNTIGRSIHFPVCPKQDLVHLFNNAEIMPEQRDKVIFFNKNGNRCQSNNNNNKEGEYDEDIDRNILNNLSLNTKNHLFEIFKDSSLDKMINFAEDLKLDINDSKDIDDEQERVGNIGKKILFDKKNNINKSISLTKKEKEHIDEISKMLKKMGYKNMECVLLEEGFDRFEKKFPFVCINHEQYKPTRVYPSMITENIFISSEYSASNPLAISHLNIKKIINCTPNVRNFFTEDAINYNIYKTKYDYIEDILHEASETLFENQPEDVFHSFVDDNLFDQQYLRISIQDSVYENIACHFKRSTDFINEDKNINVLVHCSQGVSRSVTIVCAYLILIHNFSWEESIEFVKKGRSIAKPNSSFVNQLRDFENEIKE
eukprot:TRINITY_DN16454_c0_g1_i1.p1 TRINITY_DN16454_c0_g1~~TRINITY_DN16454_c0_g1_i1.p1  ORF type:complete len:405 (+),score=85.27 TRINITY_DN16454_c0_g1_i1:105-1319(+)